MREEKGEKKGLTSEAIVCWRRPGLGASRLRLTRDVARPFWE